MHEYRIAVYPGDGIGIDVIAEGVKALKASAGRFGFLLKMTEYNWGHRYWRETGQVAPDDFLEILKPYDAIYLGAVGDPQNLPDHITLVPLIKLRQTFDQYVCLRPVQLLPGVTTPLCDKQPGQIDMMVVRENSEGEYIDAGGAFKVGRDDELSMQTAIHTRKGVERILRYSFELARKRRRHITMATKSNAMKYAMVMWDRILAEVAPDFPDVRFDKCHIDALSMNFVRQPEQYDVVVGSNLFGDILSDLGGAIVGSLGLAPSANIRPDRQYPSLFEPVHGSAPDIAGKGIANPIAAIRSAAMLLDFLGEPGAAQAVEAAVIANLAEGRVRTPDIGGRHTTSDVGDDIAARI
ncbi:MAG: tartrate dehydrogenase [Chloroflexi bacterium]|nr:tartrate dehydrogenase [Chloroflexota bacterium]MCL5273779.1 tartrate dehydrogenase [Chloroflexota bacterium]